MAYDEGLAQRIEEILEAQPGLEAKKMFGGVGYMLHGNMACGVHKDMLIVRIGLDGHEEAMSHPHTLPFDITGRAMKGWVMVSTGGYGTDEELRGWVNIGIEFALTLPEK